MNQFLNHSFDKKALEMNIKLGGPEDFKASSGWLHKIKSRHGILVLQIQGKLFSADSSGAKNFKETFRLFVEKERYSQDAVYNADAKWLKLKSTTKKITCFLTRTLRTCSAWF